MALGKAVICSDNPAFDGTFTHGKNALRVPARNPGALADAMRQMVSMDLAAMGSINLDRCRSFNWPTIARRYLEVVEAAIAARARP